jgi:hypothetical protein
VKHVKKLKFKSEGNTFQFRFNEEIAADLAKLQKHCTSSVNNSLVTDIWGKLKSRNKLIRIADKPMRKGGWGVELRTQLKFGLGRVSDLAGAEYLLYGVVRIFPLFQ